MSKFRQLVESLLQEEYEFLEGSFVPFKTPVANLTNALYKSLIEKPLVDGNNKPVSATPLIIEKVSEGHDKRKADEIVSYYITITATKYYKIRDKRIEVPVTVKCRCSTHDKPNQEIDPPKDINVFIPTPDNPKPFIRDGLPCYDLSKDKIDAYVNKARENIAATIVKKRKYILEPLVQIEYNDDMYKDVSSGNKLDQELVHKYDSLNNGNIIYQKFFKNWLETIKKGKTL